MRRGRLKMGIVPHVGMDVMKSKQLPGVPPPPGKHEDTSSPGRDLIKLVSGFWGRYCTFLFLENP